MGRINLALRNTIQSAAIAFAVSLGRWLCRLTEHEPHRYFTGPARGRVTTKSMERFISYDGRGQTLARLNDPQRIPYWLMAYAHMAYHSGFTHTAAHALGEAAFGLHRDRPELARILTDIARRLFAETDSGPSCRAVVTALEIVLDTKRRIDVVGPGLDSTVAAVLHSLNASTQVPPRLELWVDMTATAHGYPADCGLLPPSAAPTLVPGAHRGPARKILRALRDNDTDLAHDIASKFADEAKNCGNHELGYQEVRDLARTMLTQRHHWLALWLAANLFTLATDITLATEVAALCRHIAAGAENRQLRFTAKAYQAHSLARGHSKEQFIEGARLATAALTAGEADEYPEVRDHLLWTAYFVLHKLGDYGSALGCLDSIEPDTNRDETELRWARYDLYNHIGLTVDDALITQLRTDVVKQGDVRWLAQVDALLGMHHIGQGDVAAGIHHLMIAAEGFRRTGAVDHMANCFGMLGQIWIKDKKWEPALHSISVALRVHEELGDGYQCASLRFDGARVLYHLGEIDIDQLTTAFHSAQQGCTFEHQVTTGLQFFEDIGDERPEIRFTHANAILEAFTTWWSSQPMTSWRAALLVYEQGVRGAAITAAVQLGHPPAAVVRLIIEGANLALPAAGPAEPAVVDDHQLIDHPELVEELAETLTGKTRHAVLDDPGVHYIPLAPPTRVAIDREATGIVHLPTLARGAAANPNWIWWTQWSHQSILYHGVVTSAGECWYEETSLPAVLDAAAAYNQVLPLVAGDDGDVRGRMKAAVQGTPAQEERLAAAFGAAVLPPRLAERLDDATTDDTTLIIQPNRAIAPIPFALLPLPGRHTRLAHHAAIDHCPGLGLFIPAPDRPAPATGTALVLDPGGARLLGRNAVALPDVDDLTYVFAGPALPEWAASTLGPALPADRETLRSTLTEHPVQRLIYAGHITATDILTPGASAFILRDGALSAVDWLRRPELLPAPAELILVACDSFASRALEPLALPTAALAAGVDRIIASAWPVPNTAGMWDACAELIRVTEKKAFAAAISELTTTRLRAWQETGHQLLHPLHWSAFVAIERAPVRVVRAALGTEQSIPRGRVA